MLDKPFSRRLYDRKIMKKVSSKENVSASLYENGGIVHQYEAYSCEDCDFKASRRSDLVWHKKSKHEGVVYECSNCELKTSRLDNLRWHQKLKHTV